MTHSHTPAPADEQSGETSHVAVSDAMVEAARNAFKRRGWGYRDEDIRAALTAALTAEPGEAVAYEPCGGCGEKNPDKRCIGCLHPFSALAHPLPLKEEVERVLEALLRRDEINTCKHEETHRGGFLWEICDQCGAKWADDKGGKPEWSDPAEWVAARALLSRIRAGAQEGWRDIPVTDETISYVWHYGGRCRDCADAFGVCPTSGLPCEPDEAKAAIRHVLRAVNYGMSNGYLPAAPSPEAKGGERP